MTSVPRRTFDGRWPGHNDIVAVGNGKRQARRDTELALLRGCRDGIGLAVTMMGVMAVRERRLGQHRWTQSCELAREQIPWHIAERNERTQQEGCGEREQQGLG